MMRIRTDSPIRKKSSVYPRHSTHTVWSTALGLHMDSIAEEEQEKLDISDMWVRIIITWLNLQSDILTLFDLL